MKGRGGVICYGPVAETKLIYVLQRHVWGFWWTNIRNYNSGWQKRVGIVVELSGQCTSGRHTYRVVVDGYGKSRTGHVESDQAVNDKARIRC